jgi:hypothetical protein
MQPVGQCLTLADQPRVTSQDEEGGLESVLRVLLVTQGTPTHTQHHRPVARDEGGEGRLVATGGERIEQLLVGPLANRRQLSKVAQDRVELCRAHGRRLRFRAPAIVVPETRSSPPVFRSS